MSYWERKLWNDCILCGKHAPLGSQYCYQDDCARQYIQSCAQVGRDRLWNVGYNVGYGREQIKMPSRYNMKYRGVAGTQDETERIIRRNYLYQPKYRDYLIQKHRLGKAKSQQVANLQFAKWQRIKKMAEKGKSLAKELKNKTGIDVYVGAKN